MVELGVSLFHDVFEFCEVDVIYLMKFTPLTMNSAKNVIFDLFRETRVFA